MLRAFCVVALFAAGLSAASNPANAGGWSGGERDVMFAPFKRGYTLERVWVRLGSRRPF
ncbi:MAG: hypothetical protein HOP09_08455 [Hyphomicrobium sp.]|nr:hypothetical protein [Hyphomicrobium sp.]